MTGPHTPLQRITHILRLSFSAQVAIGYAGLAGLYVFFSDRLIDKLSDEVATLSQLRDWSMPAFILMSAILLYTTLRVHRRSVVQLAEMQPVDGEQITRKPIFALFAVLSVIILSISYLDLNRASKALIAQEFKQQANVLTLKVNDISDWISERRLDISLLENGLKTLYANEQFQPDRLRRDIEHYMADALHRVDAWSRVSLFSPDGQLLLHVGENPNISPPSLERIREAARASGIDIVEFPDPGDAPAHNVRINFLTRIENPAAPSVAAGVIVLGADPSRRLLRAGNAWPFADKSSEILVLYQSGDQIHVLNHTRENEESDSLSLAAERAKQSLEAQAIDRGHGRYEGLDHRGVEVVASYGPIEGTTWLFVAKTDRNEILQPLYERRLVVLMLALFFIAAAAFIAGLLWRNQQLSFLAYRANQRRDREAAARHFDKFFQLARDIYLLMDEQGIIVEANEAALSAYGYKREELIGLNISALRAPEARATLDSQWQASKGIDAVLFETSHLRKYGTSFPVEVSSRMLEIDGKQYHQSLIRDITARKATEAALKEANRITMATRLANSVLLRSQTEDGIYADMCRAIVEIGGYRMAAVCLAENDDAQSVRIAGLAGTGQEYLAQAQLSWGDNPHGQGPTGTAIRSSKTQVNQDFATNPAMTLWRDQALRHGFKSSISLPLLDKGKAFGALAIYSHQIDAFNMPEVLLLQDLAEDISFGISVLRLRTSERATTEKLNQSLERTIRLLAETMELRDPYTSGHQQRVADLARAIAIEIGIAPQDVHGIYLAGLIHDIGKIAVPAEFLSKPTRLTPQEMALVQTHSQVGGDLIKDIDFPWPIAEIVRGHHEKLDGSGYPNKLKGDEIPIGARIMAVADVVEAISAHRPYRPALGLDKALEEITAQRGKLFDPAVVDACLALFASGRFAFAPRQAAI